MDFTIWGDRYVLNWVLRGIPVVYLSILVTNNNFYDYYVPSILVTNNNFYDYYVPSQTVGKYCTYNHIFVTIFPDKAQVLTKLRWEIFTNS